MPRLSPLSLAIIALLGTLPGPVLAQATAPENIALDTQADGTPLPHI